MAGVGSVLGEVAGSAAGAAMAPVSGIVGVIGSLVSKAMDFIPDPAKKLELQQHAMDLQAQASEQELSAMTQQVVAAQKASASDTSLWQVRAFYCYTMCAILVFNLVIVPLLHAFGHLDIAPLMLPTNLLAVFAIIMVGLTGVPTGFQAIQNIMQMPGESQISVLGVKVGNKS